MDFSSINYLSVGLATLAAYVLGALYYTVLGKVWARAAKLDLATMKRSAAPFIISFIAEFVLAMVLYFILEDITLTGTFSNDLDLKGSVAWVLVFWLGLVAMPLVINHRYQGFSWALTIIDGIHWLLVLLVMAGVIGWFGASEVLS